MTTEQFKAEKQRLTTVRTAWRFDILMPSDLIIKPIDLADKKADSANDPTLACPDTRTPPQRSHSPPAVADTLQA